MVTKLNISRLLLAMLDATKAIFTFNRQKIPKKETAKDKRLPQVSWDNP